MAKPIRILHVLGRTDRGGAESLVMNIYRNIDRSKVQFDFAIHTNDRCQFDDEIESLGGKIYHLPRYRVYNHLIYIKMRNRLLSNNSFVAVHGHMNSTASIYLKIAKKYKLITISHIHNVNGEKGIKSIIKNIYRIGINNNSDYKFACSVETGEYLYGKNSHNFQVIKNGIEVKKFTFNENVRNLVRNDLGISDNEIVIGHVGNFRPVKNHKFALELFRKLNCLDNRYRLILVGENVKENLYHHIRDINLEKRIFFLGSRPDINNILQAFDIFILPSYHEGLPVTSIEAQASDLICILSSNITRECKISKKTHFLTIDDKDSLNDWVHLIHDIKRFERQDVENIITDSGYNIKSISKNLESFYLSLI